MTRAGTWLARAWRAWVTFWDRREPPTALALVRILVALVLLGDYLYVWNAGLIDPLWSTLPDGFALGHHGWAEALGIDAFGLWALATGALVLVLFGIATPLACVAFAVISAQQSMIAPYAESAVDVLMRIVFVVLALSRCNARWSVDAWVMRRLGRPMAALVPAWPRHLLLLQVVWMYFSAGQNKSSHVWDPIGGFTALANAMLDPHNGRLAPGFVGAIYPLTRVATALTIVFELSALLYLLWLYYAATADRPGRLRRFANRFRLRWIWFALYLAFEVGIAVGLKLGSFPYGMLALFPVLLLPDEVERLVSWLARRGAQRLNTPAPANRASSPS
ncbi:MAG TPA: HTTM domain-containing protein [Kofleriaceae bacterium]|nr:HTTM domain-containing protein [Kofleriaceae bacterium]